MKIEAVSKTYQKKTVLDLPSFSVEDGCITAVIGANGSGKSTLGKILAGIEKPDNGKAFAETYKVGYMPEKSLAHYRTLLSIEWTLGQHRKADAAYLDACRAKRNHVEYDYVQGASAAEAAELLDFAKDLRNEVIGKLAPKYPELQRL